MEFNLQKSISILERTPQVLKALLQDLHPDWVIHNEEGDSWSPFDVVGHLIHGERTDWMARIRKCLSEEDKEFVPFDRFAQFQESMGKNMEMLLEEFAHLRQNNLQALAALNISAEDLDKTGIHPAFGTVTLRQLLATWCAHDLAHISQITRVMAKQYKEVVGPWKEYLSIMNK